MTARSGTAQASRMPAALAAHYIDVDELTLAQLLVIARDSAGQVAFAGGAPGTYWNQYFERDEIMVMAAIMATRVPAATAQFERLLAPAGAQPDAQRMLKAWRHQLDGWAATLQQHGGVQGADLGAMLAGLLQRVRPTLPAQRTSRQMLRTDFLQLMEVVEMTQRAAAAHLPLALQSGQHDPGIGMLVAFVQLYRRAQDKLNRFTERHLDFYYDQVLHVRPRGAERDAAFLVFDAAPAGAAIPIPAGTRFLAPYERAAPELEFVTEHPIVVTDAHIVALHTVHFERNRLSFPESKLVERAHRAGRTYPTGCHVNLVPLVPPGLVHKGAAAPAAPLFGAPRNAALAPPGSVGRLGFALASNVLLMGHGERRVDVTLYLGHAGAPEDGFTARLDAVVAAAAQRPARGGAAGDPAVRYRVLNRMFTISISGSAGWITVSEYSAAPGDGHGGADVLHLSFRLGPEVEAVVPYAPALHGEHYPSNCPVVRFELNPAAYVYPYGLLQGLRLVQAHVAVDVRGHRALALQNQIGLLSAAAPFQPFGPLPAVGACLIVGSPEAACKNLSAFELVLAWGGLPGGVRGLGDYYAGYGEAANASRFRDVRASLSILSDGAWTPRGAAAQPQVTLFGAAPDAAGAIAAAPAVRFDRLLAQGRPMRRADGPAPFVYTPGVRGGFFKIALAGPDFLFGHHAYPLALADALGHNGHPRNRARLRALPAPPYTPVLDGISLNYSASADIVATPSAEGDAFIRLAPMGWDAARGTGHGDDLLLPPFDDSGNLHIGVAATALRAPLTLFFHLREDALPMVEPAPRELRWSYLAGNTWRPFAPHAVRADSTHAFLRAGVVTLTLPPDITSNSTILPGGLYWLRVACDVELARFCSLYAVSTHAARVFRDLDAVAAPRAPASIAAGTITRPRQAIPGLGRVRQVTASTGGRLAESRHDMRRRTAERLRHKGQAITPDDYERLILAQFPEIDRVKCFANRSVATRAADGIRPGHVLIVGLPAFHSTGHLVHYPRLNGYLIGQVRQFIEAHVSPAVTLEVVNPVYQHIQVRCTVELRAGADPGWYVNELDAVISDFISPWSLRGNTSHFGWTIRRHDIESFILAHEGVLSVSGFSMLALSERDHDLFALTDTARPGAAGAGTGGDIEPVHPWSVAVPFKRHDITVRHADAPAAAGRATGIGQMEIGSTFIIGARRDEK